jgi:hypothetical protein
MDFLASKFEEIKKSNLELKHKMKRKRDRFQRKMAFLIDTRTGAFRSIGGCQPSQPEWMEQSEFLEAESEEDEMPVLFELPPMVDMRPFMTAVEDQAQANSCTANAVVGGMYVFLPKNLSEWIVLLQLIKLLSIV